MSWIAFDWQFRSNSGTLKRSELQVNYLSLVKVLLIEACASLDTDEKGHPHARAFTIRAYKAISNTPIGGPVTKVRLVAREVINAP